MSTEKRSHPGPPPPISSFDVLVKVKGFDDESGQMVVSKVLLYIDP